MTYNTALAVPEPNSVITPGIIAQAEIASPQIVLYTRGNENVRIITNTNATRTGVMTDTTNGIITNTFSGYITTTSTTGTTIIHNLNATGGWIQTSGTTGTIYLPNSTTSNVIFWNESGWTPTEDNLAYQARQRRRYERDRRASIHKAKSAIKKALKLIDNMGFGDEIRVFIGGDEIVIDNPQSIFKFVLKRGQSIIEKTINPGYSTPYKLELLTKDDVHVSNLCVYLKDTPVLDQILAVALYIKTGNEEDVLEKANWFNVTRDEGVKRLVSDYNPNLAKKIGYKLDNQAQSGVYAGNFEGYIQSNHGIVIPA